MLRFYTFHKVMTVFLFAVAFGLVLGGKAHAASITVATGNDETTANSNCSLSEAITNINNGDATSYPECTGSGAFGTDDTINVPAGTVTLVADLPTINLPITLAGQGMGKSVIDGDGQWKNIEAGGFVTASNLTLTGCIDIGVLLNAGGRLDNIEVNGANWGITDPSGIAAGIIAANSTISDTTLDATNIYVHNFNVNVSQIIPFGVSGGATRNLTASLRNITITDITNTGSVQVIMVTAGLFDGGASTGAVDADIANATITGITSLNDVISGILMAGSTQSTAVINAKVENSTFSNLYASGTNSFLSELGNGAVIAQAGSAVDSMTINTTVGNLLIAHNNIAHCGVASLNGIYSVSGDVINNIVSTGGNLSDSDSCSQYFTQTTDQINLTGLKDYLGPISFNGGYVPTIPLLQGSPAIDSGVTVAGLTTDARGAVRPQGSAYDSGAYESPYTKSVASLASTGESTTLYVLLSAIMSTVGLGIITLKLNRS